MSITKEILEGLDLAINEANLRDLQVNVEQRHAVLDLDIFQTAPPARSQHRVSLHLNTVARLVASLRLCPWDTPDAPVQPMELVELPAVVRSFGGEPIYGARFFDQPDEDTFGVWAEHVSLDIVLDPSGAAHTLDVFQEDAFLSRRLDVRVWFGELAVLGGEGAALDLGELAAGGVRWWDALFRGDL